MKIAIIGSRNFKNLKLIDDYILHKIVKNLDLWEINPDGVNLLPLCKIISGKGGLVDLRAAQVARQYGIPLKEFPAQWRVDGVYNNRAGIERNKLIAEYADCVVAFLDVTKDYKHSGTLSTCQFAAQLGKPVRIITGIEVSL